jgi:DNA-binding response OmpR family regulator
MMPKRILIIDDEIEFAEMVKMRLEANRYIVETAANGEEGLKKIQAQMPNLILLDVMMPGLDGYEVLRRLRHDPKMRHVPVVMLTAKGETKSIFKAQDLGSTDYLIKPCESAELLATVQKYAH